MYNMNAVTAPTMAANNGHKCCYAVYTPLSNNLQYQPTQPMAQAVRYNTAYAQPGVQQQQHPNQFVAASAAYQTQQHAATPPQYAQQMQSMRAVNQQQALVPQQQPLPQAQPLEQPASSLAPYADQLNAAYYAYQQQQQLYNQQQQQLLRNLYTNHPDKSNIVSTAKAQSPVTSNNQFYTHDQYVNYLNNQHSQILDDQQRQVQQQYRTSNYSKPTALAYSTPSTNAVPSSMVSSRNGLLGVQYSPSNKVSHVNYASGNLAYNY